MFDPVRELFTELFLREETCDCKYCKNKHRKLSLVSERWYNVCRIALLIRWTRKYGYQIGVHEFLSSRSRIWE